MSIKRTLTEKILENQEKISKWYLAHAEKAPPPFYCSIDLRDSGFKIAPVDSNLYPAGFNNICPTDLRNAPKTARKQIEYRFQKQGWNVPKKILLLPENHTQNAYYIENLYYLKQILLDAQFEVEIGWYLGESAATPPASEPILLRSASGKELKAIPLRIENGTAYAGDFKPDLLILNNDFSSGYPKSLDAVTQPIFPSHTLGWHSRTKSEHFVHYNRLAQEFAELIGIDPWLIQVDTQAVSPVNFAEEIGIEETATAAEQMLERIGAAYDRHQIKKDPFVFVKNNSGTYGMGITVVHQASEIREMNRRTKNKMSVGKNRRPIESVVVQEGIPTSTTVTGGAGKVAAEPVIYLMGCDLIGGFMRTNTQRGAEENLNSEGMVFRKLCVSDLKKLSEIEVQIEGLDADDIASDLPILELVYGSIARISALATGYEIAAHPVGGNP